MWITFEISNEVIGFARDKTIILAKNREMRGSYPPFPQGLGSVKTDIFEEILICHNQRIQYFQ